MKLWVIFIHLNFRKAAEPVLSWIGPHFIFFNYNSWNSNQLRVVKNLFYGVCKKLYEGIKFLVIKHSLSSTCLAWRWYEMEYGTLAHKFVVNKASEMRFIFVMQNGWSSLELRWAMMVTHVLSQIRTPSSLLCFVVYCCVFWPAFRCLQQMKTGRTTFFQQFSTFFVNFKPYKITICITSTLFIDGCDVYGRKVVYLKF